MNANANVLRARFGGSERRAHPLARVVADSYVIAKRNVRRLVRTPQLVVFQTVQPVMFMVMFVYVFGGAIDTPGLDYVDFLVPGVLVQATLFGGGTTSVGVARDLADGIFDRFRSLPMARVGVLAGRTLADALKNAVVLALLLGIGLAVGFRFHGSFLASLAGVSVVVAFGYAFSWVYAAIGLLVRDPEAAQVASFVPVFPLVFASSAFVPTDSMPGWLQLFAEHQPISATVDAVRALTQGGAAGGSLALTSLAWSLGILLVAVPLAINRYRTLQ